MLRLRAGMQQKELAISVGVSRPTVSEWEHGKKDPSGERLRRLSEIFNVDPGVILGYRPFMPEDQKGPVEDAEGRPKTLEARIVSGGMDQLPKEQREQILNVVRAMFAQHPELFEMKGTDEDDDSRL